MHNMWWRCRTKDKWKNCLYPSWGENSNDGDKNPYEWLKKDSTESIPIATGAKKRLDATKKI